MYRVVHPQQVNSLTTHTKRQEKYVRMESKVCTSEYAGKGDDSEKLLAFENNKRTHW